MLLQRLLRPLQEELHAGGGLLPVLLHGAVRRGVAAKELTLQQGRAND